MRQHILGMQCTWAVLVLWLIFLMFTGKAIAGCLPSPLPDTPVVPTWTLTNSNHFWGARSYTFWRVPCDESDSKILVRIEPLTTEGADVSLVLTVIQDGNQYNAALVSQIIASPCIRSKLFVPITCQVYPHGGWDDDQQFIIFDQYFPGERINIPAYDGSTFDGDSDGIPDISDNCPLISNADQADTDGDDIGDACDPLTDSDGDGIANDTDNDDDNDGMPDSYEQDNDFDSLDPVDADQDADGDGYTNLEEFKNNTDPRNKESFPKKTIDIGAILSLLLEDTPLQSNNKCIEKNLSRLTTTCWNQSVDGYAFPYDGTKAPCNAKAKDGESKNWPEYSIGCSGVAVGQLINYYFQQGYRSGWLGKILENTEVFPRFELLGFIKDRNCTFSTGYETNNTPFPSLITEDDPNRDRLRDFLWVIALGLDSHFKDEGNTIVLEKDSYYQLWGSYGNKIRTLLRDRFRFNPNITHTSVINRLRLKAEFSR